MCRCFVATLAKGRDNTLVVYLLTLFLQEVVENWNVDAKSVAAKNSESKTLLERTLASHTDIANV